MILIITDFRPSPLRKCTIIATNIVRTNPKEDKVTNQGRIPVNWGKIRPIAPKTSNIPINFKFLSEIYF